MIEVEGGCEKKSVSIRRKKNMVIEVEVDRKNIKFCSKGAKMLKSFFFLLYRFPLL